MHRERGFIPIIIIIIVVLAMGTGTGGYFLVKNSLSSKKHSEKEISSNVGKKENQIETTKSAINLPVKTARNYTNSQFGFSLVYPSGIAEFEETFETEKFYHFYACKEYDKGHETYYYTYQFSPLTIGDAYHGIAQEPCSKTNISFDEYIKEYQKQFIVQNAHNFKMTRLKTADGNEARLLYWELPLHGPTPDSPQIGWHPNYIVLVETPGHNNSQFGAIRFFLSGGSHSCPNYICEAGETPTQCPADCRDSWENILTKTFSSMIFEK